MLLEKFPEIKHRCWGGGFETPTLQGTNMSRIGKRKNHLQKYLNGRGYVSFSGGYSQVEKNL